MRMCQAADPDKPFEQFKLTRDMQYINPPSHRNFLRYIVQSDIPSIQEEIRSALAVSLRVDGSVDHFHIDNKFIMAKVVCKDGTDRLLFIGFDTGSVRGAEGE